jgi:hypothetical protein
MILKIIAAIATVGTGVLALIKPTAIYGFTGLNADGVRGISEIRAIFGGLFIALGIAPFIFGETAYLVLGLGYLVIATVRLLSILIDRSRESSNLISLAIEIVLGIILILR